MKYCIDTSGLTRGWRDSYPPNIFPSLWKDIELLIDDGSLIAPDEVFEELKRGGDDLYDWACKYPHSFISPDIEIQKTVSDILANPEHAKLVNTKSETNLIIADPFVIAVAKVHECTVVSSEEFQYSSSPKKTKIPNVCADMNIPHVSFLELIRELGWVY